MVQPDVEVLVVGGGQAGIAMSEHLSKMNVSHVVVERDRIAERWRTGRWDSLVANGPAWHDRFPNLDFDVNPDAFATKDEVAAYLEQYAKTFAGRIETGVEVTSVRRASQDSRFEVQTTMGDFKVNYVVAATGPFQKPVIPNVVPADTNIQQLHSHHYKNPEQLPEGGVLVVGAGSSGAQIAAELTKVGRDVYLAVGPHDRPPRSYRGRDFVWWLGVLGKWDMTTPGPNTEHVTIAVSGAEGGKTVDFRGLAQEGITLLGRAASFDSGTMRFNNDLQENIARGDENYLSLLEEADAYIERHGLDLPEEPEAKILGPNPPSLENPILELDLAGAGIASIIWATGFTQDYSWLEVDAFDAQGRPIHQRGVSNEPGVYFLGLPWQSRRGSSFIWGVWHDAKYLADQIDIQRSYANYRPSAKQDERSDELIKHVVTQPTGVSQ
ncbi:flavin-containing monooxygenase [Enteractinococcus helveticum]|uniref:flavin-containing monooxygenase n=1 Tax=Enteractinococcus helveticum TaxID=1837282 RepID=UPI0009EF625D|nr:NAD(P)/FAD-dependent oxidoreductase [Enteractinococcus helveticum]